MTGVRLGAHMSIAGGFERSIERGLKVGCDTVQIFSKSNNQWAARPIQADEAARFRQAAKESGITPVFAHDSYLINVGSPKPDLLEQSREALRVEVERATTLGLAFVVMHPDSHTGSGEEPALKRIAESVAWVLEKTKGSSVKILYENAAGQGSNVGHRFEHLAGLLKWTGHPDRLGICLDTCHLFSAGYDLRTKAAYEATFQEFDRIVGLKKIQAIHLNDSVKDLGSRVDRHEQIGIGKIGLEGFRCLMNDARLSRVPMVLETPKDEECTEDVMNLKVLRGLIKK
ncbi:MAG: deoxyribonuclease IV [Candidatus Omnitrophica bacterium]|nr:deoxyribonuclease IV [Candidatus Omnitrophota bacterium]